ncbi:inositol 2-dehydrogenase [Anaerotalea alkaliphila]|uniref:Inositol 2-dehydrogenase n=1 Tax=Anaerotalea alkaliphila TaxID=2662126 RepID=A0A7X5HXY4_9FIRM|nr:inositol 2-dehydrogenase [Anaerotalea alkaliphila]NDL68561.1 inositol 2-dehydrogenase [Anaerotalea alkaliphila]
MKKTTIGVIGAGAVGRVHIKNIMRMPQVRLKYVADPMPEFYNAWAKEMDFPLAVEDYKVIMEDPEVEAVIICAPAALHGDLIIEAAEKGKHVFCEKPFDYDISKIKKAMEVVEKTGIKLQLGFNRRFDKNFAKAHEYLKTGALGDVHVIKITSRDPKAPAMGYFTAPGGEHCSIYTDTTIHDFDMARFLNNSEVVEVFASGSKLINKDKPEITRVDTIVCTLKFEDGSLCVIDNSWQAVYGYDQRAEVFGTKGAVTVENDVFSQATLHTVEGIIGEKPLVTIEDRYGNAYGAEVEAFIKAVQEDTPVLVDGRDGLMSMLIAKAALLSDQENRIVKISELM